MLFGGMLAHAPFFMASSLIQSAPFFDRIKQCRGDALQQACSQLPCLRPARINPTMAGSAR
jgi:hypothetical protein